MKNNVIEEAIANIAYTSEALEKFCNHPRNYNSAGIDILEKMSWELQRHASELRELEYRFDMSLCHDGIDAENEQYSCMPSMRSLDMSRRDFM
jgi:hypothetical protein